VKKANRDGQIQVAAIVKANKWRFIHWSIHFSQLIW